MRLTQYNTHIFTVANFLIISALYPFDPNDTRTAWAHDAYRVTAATLEKSCTLKSSTFSVSIDEENFSGMFRNHRIYKVKVGTPSINNADDASHLDSRSQNQSIISLSYPTIIFDDTGGKVFDNFISTKKCTRPPGAVNKLSLRKILEQA